jgi:UDP-glucuronate 4-epimerase
MTPPVLITGAAGFIGFYLSKRLLEEGHSVVGIDNLNDYYDPALKDARLAQLTPHQNFTFIKANLADKQAVDTTFQTHKPKIVVNLAAQAGVRYSLQNPMAYVESNLQGFANILEGCRHNAVEHLIYASSSSVYGANTKMPFSEDDGVDHPVSLYAATKKSNELMAHTYSHLYGLPTTGLRFFTVYGPWGRPDMAYFSFTQRILKGETIKVFNNGDMKRDFTYIDDIVEGIVRLMPLPPEPNENDDLSSPATGKAPYRVCNIGNNNPEDLMYFITTLEELLGAESHKEFLPMQDGDVKATYADISKLNALTGFKPTTPLKEGLAQFVAWYKEFYKS